MRIPRHRTAAGWALLLLAAACASTPRETAPGGTVEPQAGPARTYADADVRFMQGMIHHHAQALEMADLVADRTETDPIRQMALRIEISQQDEIARMRRWLEARGEEVPQGHTHGALMPGMLSPDQMGQLTAARSSEFDRLFLELMIQHHEGALTMVRDLASQGGGQEAEIYLFTTDVDADQRAEIARMRDMLDSQPRGGME